MRNVLSYPRVSRVNRRNGKDYLRFAVRDDFRAGVAARILVFVFGAFDGVARVAALGFVAAFLDAFGRAARPTRPSGGAL